MVDNLHGQTALFFLFPKKSQLRAHKGGKQNEYKNRSSRKGVARGPRKRPNPLTASKQAGEPYTCRHDGATDPASERKTRPAVEEKTQLTNNQYRLSNDFGHEEQAR